ncbi:MAG: hypothetical protein CO096_09500 [Armatimonadetes bacterium CG_4_9_14_3_um_filter_66_14]|nr:MAG: hypothetical protein CO096_09500 [Armatimonadetes bacterium CG_4_9_14_3_um_filter_66_14]
MLDDEWKSAGWNIVMEAIAGNPQNVDYACNWKAAQTMLADGKHFDVMLLDCSLGDQAPTGLELLHPLREWSADLPIVMMTAHDNAELALWALRAGCNDFYAKQLADPGDRNSLSYYLRFARAVRRKETETLLRELWRKFEERLPLPQDRQEDELCVRQAFYSLFSLMDGYTWWARSGIVGTEDALSADTWLCRAALLAIGAAPTMELTKDSQEKVSAARHLDWGQRGAKSDEEEVDRLWNNAIRVVEDAVGKLGNAPNDAPLQCEFVERAGPSGCRLTREQFDAGTSPGAGGGSGVRLGHLQRSRRGAVQLALGHLAGCEGVDIGQVTGLFRDATDDPHTCLELIEGANGETRAGNHIDPGGKVVLIDDEKDANGWERALGLVYGKQLKCYASLGKFLSACHGKEVHKVADVVLLDLWLLDEATQRPSPEAGLHALEELKRLDPGLPVIVLSGATDAVNALKCMRRGALDYVPKWLDGEEEPEKWKRFAEGLTRKVTATAKLGKHRLRGLWRSMLALEAPTTTPNATAQLLEATPGWRLRYSNVPEKQSGSGSLIAAAIRQEFTDLLLPALVLYHSYLVGGLLNGEAPPLDAWRVTRVLGTRDNMPMAIALLAGRAAEFLGWAWCCVEKNHVLTKQQWKDQKDCPGWRSYIAKASSCAAEVWHKRVSAQHAMSAQKSVADPKSVLGKAFRAWDEFEETLAKRATPCQNTRMLHSPPPMADAGSGAS